MISEQFEHHELVLVPLTPIHVSGGDEAALGPEDYRLKGCFLERIDLRSFLLTAPDREPLLRDMGRDLPRTLSLIQDRIPDEAVTERVAVSEEAHVALRPAFQPSTGSEKSRRQGVVHAFLRSGGHPTLPGSSLKGCLRTAWLAKCVRDQKLSKSDAGSGRSAQRHDRLTKAAFNIRGIIYLPKRSVPPARTAWRTDHGRLPETKPY